MTKKWLLLTACVAGAMAVALLAFALIKAGHACANPNKRVALKIVEANGCFEFWVNRYQSGIWTLISIGGALGAAFVAWKAVQGQIAAQRQPNLLMRLQGERENLWAMMTEREQLSAVKKALAYIDEVRTTDWDGHERPFKHMVERLRAEAIFPFERFGPSRNALVSLADHLAARAERLDDERLKHREAAHWDDMMGQQINRLIILKPAVEAALTSVETKIMDAYKLVKFIEQEVDEHVR